MAAHVEIQTEYDHNKETIRTWFSSQKTIRITRHFNGKLRLSIRVRKN